MTSAEEARRIVAAMGAKCPQCGGKEKQNASKPEYSNCGVTVWADCGACGSRWSEEYTLTRVKMSPKDDIGLWKTTWPRSEKL